MPRDERDEGGREGEAEGREEGARGQRGCS